MTSITIDGFEVSIYKQLDFTQYNFNGQKLLHPFKTKTIKGEKVWENQMFYIDDFSDINLSECDRFDIKHDGSCGALVWNNSKNEYEPYARFDIKKKNNQFTKPSSFTSKWIECEPMPTTEEASHWPHFRPIYEDPKTYKWYINAFESSLESIKKMTKEKNGEIVTIEYMGSKFNGKPEDPIHKECGIVIHGSLRMNVPKELRNYEGFKKIFSVFHIEGLVAYPEGKSPMKIRAELFEGITWGFKKCQSENGISDQVVL